jgi:hypothetical protein
MDRIPLWAGEQIIPRISPMPIYSFVREENLIGRFNRIYDPMPGKMDIIGALENLNVAESIIPGQIENLAGESVVVSAPDPRHFSKIALESLSANCQYIALFSHCMQLAGLGRFENLYSAHPPSRVYILAEAWSMTRKNRGGSDGAWQPAIWAVWDGNGEPATDNPITPPTLHWISDRTSRL